MPLPMQAGRAKAERRIPAENRAQTSSFPGLSRHSGVCRALPGAVSFLRPCSCGGHAGAMASQTHIWTGELERALFPAAAVCRARQQCACVMRVHASVHELGAAPRASALQPASRRPPRTQTRRRRERSSRLLRTSGRRLDAAPIQRSASWQAVGEAHQLCEQRMSVSSSTEGHGEGPHGSRWVCLERALFALFALVPCHSTVFPVLLWKAPQTGGPRPRATSRQPVHARNGPVSQSGSSARKKRRRDDRPKKQGRARDAGGAVPDSPQAAAGPEEALWTTENSSRATQDRGC